MMATMTRTLKPSVGMTLAFKDDQSDPLAGVPAHVIHIWPRFRSGDYLVTLEYAEPVKTSQGLIAHIDAFVSELYQPYAQPAAAETHQAGGATGWRALAMDH